MRDILGLEYNAPSPEGSRVLALDDETADAVFDALASTTTRQVLSLLYEEPRAASDLADNTDTTVQNVRYHLDKLAAADLVEVATTRYSEKGKEMCVYAPSDAALVLFASNDDSLTARLRSALPRWVGAIGVSALASLAVQRVAEHVLTPAPIPAPRSGPETFGIMETAQSNVSETSAIAPQPEPSGLEVLLMEPGVLFFAGCLLALAMVAIFMAYRE